MIRVVFLVGDVDFVCLALSGRGFFAELSS